MKLLLAAVATACVVVLVLAQIASVQAQTVAAGVCGLPQAAFCETFDNPSPLGASTRSGNLDGVLWGTSRATNDDNPPQGQLYAWSSATRSTCGSTQTVSPENDVAICNGQLVETVDDAGQDTILALYPRQPFDVAGRTGVATFDVNNDTQGPHAAWPAFVYTDQPVPAPYGQAPGLADTPRNSMGLSIALPDCNGDSSLTGVDQMWTTTHYQLSFQSFTSVGCVHKATNSTQLNHFEVHISQSRVEVWGTDPGVANLHQLAYGNFTVPLTRGLIWIEDVHYNACKFNSQCNHTFVWDNVGFDGPVLPRDLGFDVLDASQNYSGFANLGYLVPAAGTLSLQIHNVNGIQNASGALLEFTWWPHSQDSLSYSVNGHPAHVQGWPYGANGITYSSQTIALPVPLSELQNGTNTLVLSSSDSINGGVTVANVDLILVGAGGLAGTVSSTATPTHTPTSSPTPRPSSTATTMPTKTPTPTNEPATPGPSTSGKLLGDTRTEGALDRNQPGVAEAFPFIAAASGAAGHLSLHVDGANAAPQIVVGIYANSAVADEPGVLLAQTTLNHVIRSAWNTVTLPTVPIASGTTYWIAILGPQNVGQVSFRDVSSGGMSVTSAQSTLTSLPARWSTGALWGSAPASVYVSN